MFVSSANITKHNLRERRREIFNVQGRLGSLCVRWIYGKLRYETSHAAVLFFAKAKKENKFETFLLCVREPTRRKLGKFRMQISLLVKT